MVYKLPEVVAGSFNSLVLDVTSAILIKSTLAVFSGVLLEMSDFDFKSSSFFIVFVPCTGLYVDFTPENCRFMTLDFKI